MGLIFVLAYQHHDESLISPVVAELVKRKHNIMWGWEAWPGFKSSYGKKALLLVSDAVTFGHSEGQAHVKQCRWNRIPSISIQHGIPIEQEYHEHCADAFCCWGTQWEYIFSGVKTFVTGNPAIDYYLRYQMGRFENPWGERMGLLIPAIRPDADTGDLAELGDDPMKRAQYFIEKAKQSEWDGKWLVRPHPSDTKYKARVEAYQYIVENLPAIYQDPADLSLYDVFSCCDYVLGTSTAVAEGLPFGCTVEMLNMPFIPEPNLQTFFNGADGHASERISDLIEGMMNA